MTKRFELDKYKNEIIELYINKQISCKEIADKYGYSLCGIYDALKRWNIQTRNLSQSHKRYYCNESFFEEINTEYDYQKRVFKRWNNDKNNYYISYGGKNKTLSIMEYLYDNSNIYLDRKYKKYIILKNSEKVNL